MIVQRLSELFCKYKIFSLDTYTEDTPLRVFQKLYPNNYYSSIMEEFLNIHDYKSIRRGADLPWWGKSYFTDDDKKNRIMIISQDSLSKDSGSIVFWAHLYNVINSVDEYQEYTSIQNQENLFSFYSWNKVLQQLLNWNIDLDYCYITDASKVYKEEGSYYEKNFDSAKSRELLIEEIDICNPDLIILLGGQPLKLLFPHYKYGEIVESGEYFKVCNYIVVLSPFITGQGHTQPNYHNKLEIATRLIKDFK